MRREKEELRRRSEALQKQMDYYHVASGGSVDRGDRSSQSPASTSHGNTPHNSSDDLAREAESNSSDTGSTPSISHRRTQSAELVDNMNLLLDSRNSASLTEPLNMKEARAQHLAYESQQAGTTSSTGNLQKSDRANSSSSLRKQNNNNTVQQIPSKLVTSSNSMSSLNKSNIPSSSSRSSRNVLPLNLAESSRKVSSSSKDGSGGSKTSVTKKNGDVFYF